MRARGALVAVPLLLAVAACSGGGGGGSDPATPAPMWQAEIDRILAGSPSDLERRTLADGVITDAEMRDALEAFETCVEELPYGFEVEVHADGGLEIGNLDAYFAQFGTEEEAEEAHDALMADCEIGTTAAIGPLYANLRDNPRGLTGAQRVRECYVRHDVPDGDGLDDGAFERLINDPEYTPSTAWGSSCLIDSESDELLVDRGEDIVMSQ